MRSVQVAIGGGLFLMAGLVLLLNPFATAGGPSDCASPSGPEPDGSVNVSDLLYVISDWGCTG